MKKNSKSFLITSIFITLVLILLLSVVTFVIPFKKISTEVLLTCYIISCFVIFLSGTLNITLLIQDNKKNNKVNSLPTIYFGYAMVVVQIIATAILYIYNANINIPLWSVIVVEAIILSIYLIRISISLYFRVHNIEYEDNNNAVEFINEFRARLKIFVMQCENENVKKSLSVLFDIAKHSDPVTNNKTVDIENELLSLLQELDITIKNEFENDALILIDRMIKVLNERNILCKQGK